MFATASIVRERTAEERLVKCTVDIMNHKRYVALSGILVMGERGIKDDIPTAMTNGRDEWYGREFVESLSDAELRFLILHENYHKLFRHLHVWDYLHELDHMCANMACDYVINLQITGENRDGFAKMPVDKQTGEPIGLLDVRFTDMDADQVFNILYQEKQDQGQGQGSMDHHDWDGAASMSDEEAKQLAEQIDTAIRQGVLAAGKMGSGGTRSIDRLLQPEIDWRQVLRDFVTTTCKGSDYASYSRPNRRFLHAGIYMPSGVSEKVDELVIAVDTSGSIGQGELTRFLSELQAIINNVNPTRVRIIYWDTKVCRSELYGEGGDDLLTVAQSTKPTGGGGTDITCVNKYMQDNNIKAQAVIVFTDGYLGGVHGTWDVPVLWCITSTKRFVPPVGDVIHVKV